MQDVYTLLGVDLSIPAIYHGILDPQVALRATKTLVSSSS